MNISFKKLNINKTNLNKLTKWYKNSNVYVWFEQRILSYDEIEKKYTNKLAKKEQDIFLIHYDNKDIGLFQIYKYNHEIKINNYQNIYEYDIFIGEDKYLNKGIGKEIIDLIDEKIFNEYQADAIVLRPFKRNIRAIKCYQKCGYKFIKDYNGKDTLGNKEIISLLIKDLFPDEIKKYVKNIPYKKDNIGRSSDKVYLFNKKYVLKISKDKERLAREKERIDFLNNSNIKGSKSICYIEDNNKYYYLRTYIDGYSLVDKKFINNPELLIDVLVDVIKNLRKLDKYNCPFKSTDNIGNDFVHGDLCLPNILVDKNNKLAGFIDLDNSGLGDRWYDYTWLLWSLKYNLKTDKYNKILLDKLNIKFDEQKYNQYIDKEY